MALINSTKEHTHKKNNVKRQTEPCSPFMTSGQEMEHVYSYNTGALIGLQHIESVSTVDCHR